MVFSLMKTGVSARAISVAPRAWPWMAARMRARARQLGESHAVDSWCVRESRKIYGEFFLKNIPDAIKNYIKISFVFLSRRRPRPRALPLDLLANLAKRWD